MKKLFLSLLILASIQVKSQDTTVVTGLTLKARTVLILVPFLQDFNDSAKTVVYFKWRAAVKSNTPTVSETLTGKSVIITDTLPTQMVVGMYQYLTIHGNNAMVAAISDFKSAISTKRAANTYLDKLCTDIEDQQNNFYRQLLGSGLQLLIQRRITF